MNIRRNTVGRFGVVQMVAFGAIVNLAFGCLAHVASARDTGAPIKIVAFGDSLTAGYGLKSSEAFPAQLARALTAKGHVVEVVNAGVSGDTTGAGLARFDWAIPKETQAVILELGANDALRGQDPKLTEKNLDAILSKLRARNIEVLIAGMSAPRGLGKNYAEAFDPIFKNLSQKYNQLHYPFFLDGVALDPTLNLPDGLHPTADGIAVIVQRIMPYVEKLITRVNLHKTTTN